MKVVFHAIAEDVHILESLGIPEEDFGMSEVMEMTEAEILDFIKKANEKKIGVKTEFCSNEDRIPADMFIRIVPNRDQIRWHEKRKELGDNKAEEEVIAYLEEAIADIKKKPFPFIYSAVKDGGGFMYSIHLTMSWPWPG